MRRYGRPQEIVTNRLPSCRAALHELDGSDLQSTGRWLNNRGENSHLPLRRRERAMLRFRRMRSLQTFAAVHSSVHNHFNQEHSLSSRDVFKLNRAAALAEWRKLGAARNTPAPAKLRLVRIGLTTPVQNWRAMPWRRKTQNNPPPGNPVRFMLPNDLGNIMDHLIRGVPFGRRSPRQRGPFCMLVHSSSSWGAGLTRGSGNHPTGADPISVTPRPPFASARSSSRCGRDGSAQRHGRRLSAAPGARR